MLPRHRQRERLVTFRDTGPPVGFHPSTEPYQARQPRRVLATNTCALLAEAMGPSGNCKKPTHELKATARPHRRITYRRYRVITRGSGDTPPLRERRPSIW